MGPIFASFLFLAFLSISASSSTTTYSCEINEKHCMIFLDTSNGTQYIDLIPLVTTLQAKSQSDGRYYYYMPCGGLPSTPSSSCEGSKACQDDDGNYNPIGDIDRPRCEINLATSNPKVVYFGTQESGSSGYTLRGVSVEFVCQSNSDPYFYVDQYTKIGNTYIYPFSLY
ncbi:uncharacterized protein LOC142358522, partial [Convolutriloba macropyga]|uniref:uncharacterized protein LOC142358522 n=1 Tax=Convolutriloba macropyga TaxID=536237 RepID=UPI003F525580